MQMLSSTYKHLIHDTLEFAQEVAKKKKYLLASAEDAAFFSKTEKKEQPVVQPAPKILAPLPPQPKQAPIHIAPTTPKPVLVPEGSWKEALMQHFPHLVFKEPPNDLQAKESASVWKKYQLNTPVLILSFGEELEFLKNLAKAIQTHLSPVKIINAAAFEKENTWKLLFESNTFQLVLVFEAHLKPYLKTWTGSKVPFLFLHPEMKKDKAPLWKKLCQILKK